MLVGISPELFFFFFEASECGATACRILACSKKPRVKMHNFCRGSAFIACNTGIKWFHVQLSRAQRTHCHGVVRSPSFYHGDLANEGFGKEGTHLRVPSPFFPGILLFRKPPETQGKRQVIEKNND